MAQKIFPRSLRSHQWLSHDFSFFAEKGYSSVWAKTYELTNAFLTFGQKNLLAKSKSKNHPNPRLGKSKKSTTFLKTRTVSITDGFGTFRCSPVFFKFSQRGLLKKYNPLKTASKTRPRQKMGGKKTRFQRKPLRAYSSIIVPLLKKQRKPFSFLYS